MTTMINNDLIAVLAQVRAELGLIIKQPIIDGRLHRCPVEGGRPRNMDGAYRILVDPPANLWVMNLRTKVKKVYFFGRSWTPTERREWAVKAEQNRQTREVNQQKTWNEAAQKAEHIYANAQPCLGHPYLAIKEVMPVSALRVLGSALVVPLYNSSGLLRSLQFISPAGEKRYLRGGQKGGSFFSIKMADTNQRQPLLICEGVATGLSLFEASDLEVLVSFDCFNLRDVAMEARRIWPERQIIIAADNDCGRAANVGVTKAKEAALAIGGLLTIPFWESSRACDFNDLYTDQGPEVVRAFVGAAFRAEGV